MKEAPYSLNLKTDSGYDNAMFTIRGDDADEFEDNLDKAIKDLFQKVNEASQLFHATHSAVAGLGGDEVAAKRKDKKGKGSSSESAPVEEGPEVRTCQHGKRNYRTGKGRTGTWAAYFCPERDKRNQCAPDWVDDED